MKFDNTEVVQARDIKILNTEITFDTPSLLIL